MLGFVTGASAGIGEAFACRLAAEGWDLAITARRGDRLRALAERLTGGHGVSVQIHVADLADPGDVADLEQVVAAAGPDLLVSNAAPCWSPFPSRRRCSPRWSGWPARVDGSPAWRPTPSTQCATPLIRPGTG
jgi:NAD(P)-dependent dehydrogenase (short-subunit alcohol dehydrogenase family)